MVKLNKIYTRTGDDGTTGLGTGERRLKCDARVEAFGTVDEANAAIGLAVTHLEGVESAAVAKVRDMLLRIQNDLFDLGADLCIPDTGEDMGFVPLRMVPAQVSRIEAEIDELNGELQPLNSFILPGGSPAAAALHMARTIIRRAERHMVALSKVDGEKVGEPAMHYANRVSDFLFVAARYLNAQDGGDILWVAGKNR